MLKKIAIRSFLFLIALLFLQFPLYVTLYMTCLDGHGSELKVLVEQFRDAAHATHKTLDQYIAKFKVQEDPDFRQQGIIMQNTWERYVWVTKASSALEATPSLLRPLVFVRYCDRVIAREAWSHYSFGLIINLDTVVWAVVGICLTYVMILVGPAAIAVVRRK